MYVCVCVCACSGSESTDVGSMRMAGVFYNFNSYIHDSMHLKTALKLIFCLFTRCIFTTILLQSIYMYITNFREVFVQARTISAQ